MGARLGGSDDNGSESRTRIRGNPAAPKAGSGIRWALFGYSVVVVVGGVIFLVVDWMT